MSPFVKVAIATAVLIAFFMSLPTLVDKFVLRNVPTSGTQTAFDPTEAPSVPSMQAIGATRSTVSPSAPATPTMVTAQVTEASGLSLSPTPQATEALSATVRASDTTESDTFALQKRLIAFEAALRTGELEARVDYGKGNSTVSLVRFDFGGDQQPARLAITSIYTNSAQTHTTERITIGSQTWQRQDTGAWTVQQEQTTIAEQVGPFLPMAASIVDPRIALQDQRAALAWSDASRDAELLLLIDRTSGIPQEMHQTTRQTGQALVITYKAWNTPVTIEAPDVKQ